MTLPTHLPYADYPLLFYAMLPLEQDDSQSPSASLLVLLYHRLVLLGKVSTADDAVRFTAEVLKTGDISSPALRPVSSIADISGDVGVDITPRLTDVSGDVFRPIEVGTDITPGGGIPIPRGRWPAPTLHTRRSG